MAAHKVSSMFSARGAHMTGPLFESMATLSVLTTGTTAYRRPDGVLVVPLALLGD